MTTRSSKIKTVETVTPDPGSEIAFIMSGPTKRRDAPRSIGTDTIPLANDDRSQCDGCDSTCSGCEKDKDDLLYKLFKAETLASRLQQKVDDLEVINHQYLYLRQNQTINVKNLTSRLQQRVDDLENINRQYLYFRKNFTVFVDNINSAMIPDSYTDSPMIPDSSTDSAHGDDN